MFRILNIAVGLVVLQGVLSFVPIEDLFPYGPSNGDSAMPKSDDDYVIVPIMSPNVFNFFSKTYHALYLNTNGGISFGREVIAFTPNCSSQSTPMIMPYWADVNTEIGGNIYYRATENVTLLEKAAVEVRRAYPRSRTPLKWLFIATWDDTAFFGASPTSCNGTSFRNTFQTILVTDEENKSFVMFFYNNIDWTTGTASEGDCYGRGGVPAKSGFDLGDDSTLFALPGSCTAAVSEVTNTTNVDQPGKWIFRVDTSFDEPEPAENLTTTETYDFNTTTPAYDYNTTSPVYDFNATTSIYEDLTSTVVYNESSSSAPIDDHCDITSCQHSGHCFEYSSCNHHTGTWERRNCSVGLFWNPHHTGNATSSECYGNCDLWENLAQETKDAYKADENCFPYCFYHEAGECSGAYLFHSSKGDSRKVETVNCPVDHRDGRNISLVWVQDRETCDFCYNAQKRDGSLCCSKYDSSLEEEPAASESDIEIRHIGPDPAPIEPVNITLKPGEIKNVTITVELAPYPLDLYFLMDISGSMGDDKANIVNLSSSIISTLGDLTNDFTLGFGAYSDRNDFFSHKHILALTNDTSTFSSTVNATPILFGGDFPEDAASAIIQSVLCEKEIGWRKSTRKMILLVTDATFHVAGDSSFTASAPFDMQCHLGADGNYTQKTTNDYPTMAQLVNTLNDHGITALFGIVAQPPFYQAVADQLVPQGGIGILNRDSSNIIDLINTEYKKIASRIEIKNSPLASDDVDITYFSNCDPYGNSTAPVIETSVCTELPQTGEVQFTVQFDLSTCPTDTGVKNQVIEISVAGLPGTVEVPLSLVC